MARRRPLNRRAVAARDWQTPADVVADLRTLDGVDTRDLRDHALYIDAVRWSRASSHSPRDWLAVTPDLPRALPLLLWQVHQVWPSRPGNLAQRMADGWRAAETALAQPSSASPAPF